MVNWKAANLRKAEIGLQCLLLAVNCIALLNGGLFAVYQAYFKYIYAGVLVVLICLSLLRQWPKLPLKEMFPYGVMVAFFLIVALIKRLPFSSVATFLTAIASLYCFRDVVLSRKQMQLLFYVMGAAYVMALLNTPFHFARWEITKDLIIQINPNTYGFFLVYGALILNYFCNVLGYSPYIKLGILLAATVGSLFLEARMCLVCLVVYLILAIFFDRYADSKRRKKTVLILAACVVAGGTFLPFVYTKAMEYMLNNAVVKSDILSRYNQWYAFYSYFAVNPWHIFFGVEAESVSDVVKQVHNNYLTVIGYCGVIGMAIYAWLLHSALGGSIARGMRNSEAKLRLGFLLVLVFGITEVSLFWLPMYPITYMMLGIRAEKQIRLKE